MPITLSNIAKTPRFNLDRLIRTRLAQVSVARVGSILVIGLAATGYLIGCASGPTRPSQTTTQPTSQQGTAPVIAASKPAQRAQTAPANQSPSRNTPIADKPINIAGQCSQTEEDGFREQAKLDVQGNEVKALDWKMWIGKRGSCSFDGSEFTQTQSRPHIELLAKDGSQCKLMIWQSPDRVTLAHANCQKRCSPGVYDDAWPVMFHPKTGVCARIG